MPTFRYVVYDLLTRDGWRDKIRPLAQNWVQDPNNIARAEQSVGRVAGHADSLIRAFGMLRLRSRDNIKDWTPVPDGLGNDG